ncbi:non-specific serine/threonine protein kinase [Malassezia brasiliensis]|uniref:non-specific serine/threonine protein kinase n=1 Tax=Malassezia brasiliensis TaxID=1821822 RepID=A0AAF0DSF7_9BASI|nr:non-specific serine/threonine protein kinase [Malassezia brasiliensis]
MDDEPGGDCGLLQLVRDTQRAALVKQGAEAKVYRVVLYEREIGVTLPNKPAESRVEEHVVLLKHRFFKRYRHPTLSASITLARTVSEARSLVRSARSGVAVPRVELVDETRGLLGLEWIEGVSVRRWLGGLPEDGETDTTLPENVLPPTEANQLNAMDRIGEQLARMHCADVIHGDLTTSNMMLRTGATIDLVLIDFGLASVSSFWEDKAVDLYVLERAFASTHPTSQALFHRVLESYAEHTTQFAPKGGKAQNAWQHIHARLQEVRLRGRKRSMVG